MKKGNIVIIRDSSFSRSVINGELVEEFLACDNKGDKQYVIVETGCMFPVTNVYQARGLTSFNDTVIQAVDSGEVVFIEERFLCLVKPTHNVMINLEHFSGMLGGTLYKISDELYREIKDGNS